MAKAVLVTEGNKEMLRQQYNLDDGEIDEYVGLYLVADFGGEEPKVYHGYLTEEVLNSNFVKTGETLDNGYFEVKRK